MTTAESAPGGSDEHGAESFGAPACKYQTTWRRMHVIERRVIRDTASAVTVLMLLGGCSAASVSSEGAERASATTGTSGEANHYLQDAVVGTWDCAAEWDGSQGTLTAILHEGGAGSLNLRPPNQSEEKVSIKYQIDGDRVGLAWPADSDMMWASGLPEDAYGDFTLTEETTGTQEATVFDVSYYDGSLSFSFAKPSGNGGESGSLRCTRQ